MTLKRRLILQMSVLLVGVALLGLAAIVGVSGLHQDMSVAVRANEQLRQTFTVGSRVNACMNAINGTRENRRTAIASLMQAADLFDTFSRSQGPHAWLGETRGDSQKVANAFAVTIGRLEKIDVRESIDTAEFAPIFNALADLTSHTQSLLIARQQSADRVHQQTLVGVGSIALVVLCAAVVIAVRQYRSVTRPLAQLREATRVLASGKLDRRVTETGDREFVNLAADFNAMVAELQQLYSELEQRIESKSRELVRSEKLASVGYLAAGVAHEINNPLGIITGYSERSLQRLGRGIDGESVPKLQQAMQIICEEAFRCKGITERLLALARPADAGRANVSLVAIVEEVVRSVGGFTRFSDRKILVQKPEGATIRVNANDGELRQIILNLLINALEATSPESGVVRVDLHCAAGEAKLAISDNGVGMSPATIEHVFEPFFSEKREDRKGTGLGLSIVRSIVADHGGTISALSEGEGRGSCFTVTLPLEREEAHAEHD